MTNGTLGNFTVRVQGSLVALPNGGWSAKGTIEFYDLWNFDPKWFAKGSNRSLQGELKTITGHMLLPGRGFEIHSASVPFSQTDNDPTVVWAGGTPQGVPDRVSQVESGG